MTRLRTLRRAAERAGEELVPVPVRLNHDARRQVWYQQAGAPDKKEAVDLVNEFKEEDFDHE
jgi:hypothetical protein